MFEVNYALKVHSNIKYITNEIYDCLWMDMIEHGAWVAIRVIVGTVSLFALNVLQALVQKEM